MVRFAVPSFMLALALAGGANAQSRVAANYGYGQGDAASGPVIDLRGQLPPAPKPALPQALAPVAPRIEPVAVQQTAGAEGVAGWYDRGDGVLTASGEAFDSAGLIGAHADMPLSSLAMVTNLENNREVIVRVNDRPAGRDDRLILVSPLAADFLGFKNEGAARVRVRYLGPAPFIKNTRPPGAPPAQPAAPALPAEPVPTPQPAPAAEPVFTPVDYPDAPPPFQPEPPTQGEGSFLVQVGAFGDPANAERARAQAAEAGHVSIEPAMVGGRTIYRVRLGPWTNEAGAEEARKKAASLGFFDARVTTR